MPIQSGKYKVMGLLLIILLELIMIKDYYEQ